VIGIPQDPQVLAEKLGMDPEAAATIPEAAAVVLGTLCPRRTILCRRAT
jgi:hypothetical protein